MRKVSKSKSPSKVIARPPGITKRRKKRFFFTKRKAVKRQGFDAFTVKGDIIDESGNTIEKIEVVAPETGIHSLDWALSIVPQPRSFLRLPVEIRHKIYEYCVLNSQPFPIIRPRKHGKKFISLADSLVLSIYNILSLICRQTYVDTVGGGLIYSISRFQFSSPDTMINYLSCINPTHKALIRNLQLGVSISRSQKNIPKRVFVTLASLALLRDLSMTLEFNDYVSEDIFKKIKDNQHWEMIKGLKKFEIGWIGRSYSYQQNWPWSFDISEAISTAQAIKKKVLAS